MLKRAFGGNAVAGQGDYFQVHVDAQLADPGEVKSFLRAALYRRFGLAPEPDFVELHPGGRALGLRLSRCEELAQLAPRLQVLARRTAQEQGVQRDALQGVTAGR